MPGLGTPDFLVPYLLPAWVPASLATRAFLAVIPLVHAFNLRSRYVLPEFPPGFDYKATLPAQPDAALLQVSDLTVCGVRGTGPFGRPPGRAVRVGGTTGTLTISGGTALLRLRLREVEYGIWAKGPSAAPWVTDMARSLTEVALSPG